MKDIVYLDFRKEFNACKETPSGMQTNLFIDELDVSFEANTIWQFVRGCDIVYYGKSLYYLCRFLTNSDVDYDFTSVSLVDILEVETALNPISLDGILFRRKNKEKESNLQAVIDIFKDQRTNISDDIKTIDEMSQKEDKRVDASGLLIQRDGIIKMKKDGTILFKNLGYAQSLLNNYKVPKDTREAVKNLFESLG